MKNRFGIAVQKGFTVKARHPRGGEVAGKVTRVFTENGAKRFEIDDAMTFALDDAFESNAPFPKLRKRNPSKHVIDPGISADNRLSSHDRAMLHAVAYSKNQPLPVFVMDYGGPSPYYVTTEPDLQSGVPAVYRVFLNGKRADFDDVTVEAPKARKSRKNPAPRRSASKAFPVATGRFRVFFANHDYFSQEEFTSADKAIAYAKSKGFDATIYDPAGNPIAAWSIIGGTRNLNPIGEPKRGEIIYWAETRGRFPMLFSPHYPSRKQAQIFAKVLGAGAKTAVAVMRGTHDDYLRSTKIDE